jgi:formamidopyrimidine-DNA glycosylase
VPELPEVETARRWLAPVLEGARLVEVELRHPRTGRRNVNPGDVPDRLTGRTVLSLRRKGKFLFADLDGDLTWIIHLGMSGRLQIKAPQEAEDPHTHFRALTDRGDEIRLVDPRTFGFVAVLTPEEMEYFVHPGADALTELPFVRTLESRLQGRTAPIKALLLDQRIISGLGNIYADEVLHRARIHPLRPAGTLSREELSNMRSSVGPILASGIRAGGTSLPDLAYLLPDGQAGDNLRRLRVYGREGQRCRRCGTVIERVVISGRSSFFCPGCQK